MRKGILKLSCLAFVIGAVMSTNTYAETSDTGSAYLTKLGIKMADRGRQEEAVHELSKALMLDPDNQKAKDALKKMGIDYGRYKGTKTKTSELLQLTKHISLYKNQVETLMKEKQILEAKLNELLLERDTLSKKTFAHDLEMDMLQVRLDQTADVYQSEQEVKLRQMEQIEDLYLTRLEDLENDQDYQSSLAKKEEMLLRERAMRDKEVHFLSVNSQLMEAVDKLIVYEDHLKEIDKLYFDLKDKITTKRTIDVDMLAFLEENIDEQRKIIDDLKDKIVFDSF